MRQVVQEQDNELKKQKPMPMQVGWWATMHTEFRSIGCGRYTLSDAELLTIVTHNDPVLTDRRMDTFLVAVICRGHLDPTHIIESA